MSKLVAHVGLPKTGTTTLQRHVFLKHPDIFSILMAGDPQSHELCSVIDKLNRTKTSDIASIVKSYREKAEAIKDPRPRLISREDFMFPRKTDIATAPEKLHKTIGDAHIIIVVREQFSWLQSYYFHHQRRHSMRKFQSPSNYVQTELAKTENSALSVLDFDHLVSLWEATFRPENVTVVPYELMKKAPDRFFDAFAKPLGLEAASFAALLTEAKSENERFTMDDWHAARVITHIRNKAPVLFALARLFRFDFSKTETLDIGPARFDFSTVIPQDVVDQWAAGNRQIEQRYGLDLSGLGYV